MDLRDYLILYVDDERANRVVFDQTFGKKYRVKSVDSGQAALAVVAAEPVAVLVTDQRMPEMSGDELLKRFKETSPETIRIVVTAYSDIEPILHAVNEGLVVRYIVKPWDRKELDEILRWAIEAHALGRKDSALQLRLVETERLLTLGQVAAYVIHDVGSLLGTVKPNLELLEEMARTVQPILRALLAGEQVVFTAQDRKLIDLYADDLPVMASDLRNAATIMTDLMASLRAFQNRTPAVVGPREVDPMDVVRLVRVLCKHGTVESKSRLEYDGATDLPRVRATAAELTQILLNLVRNAQQAMIGMPPGGVVAIHAADQNDVVRFTVRDTGPGMREEILAKIGTPFFTTKDQGTGLGFAQCKRLVAALGGTLEIRSATSGPSPGTTVTFTIPKAP